jgi:hypothetical protein
MKRTFSFILLMTIILTTTLNFKTLSEEEPPLFGSTFNTQSFSEEEPPLFGSNKELNIKVGPQSEEEPPLFG